MVLGEKHGTNYLPCTKSLQFDTDYSRYLSKHPAED